MHHLKILLPAIIFFCCCRVTAQEKAKTTDLFLTIDSVYTLQGTFRALIKGGKNFGLEEKMQIKAYPRWRAATATTAAVSFTDVGFGWITTVIDNYAICQVNHYDTNMMITKGDVVLVKVQTPAVPYRSIFSELAFENIEFLNISKQPLYSLKQLWWRDSRQIEDSIINVIIKDIKETYEMVAGITDTSFNALKKPLVGSRFKGKSVMDMMRDVNREALMGYLVFVKNFPGKYIGQNYKANETYATWVLNNAPYTKPDVLKALLPVYTDKKKLALLLPEFRYDIKNSALIKSFSEDAVEQSQANQKKEAQQLMAFTKTIAYAINDTAGKAWYHLNEAQLLQYAEKYAEAIAECNVAIQFALLCGKKETEVIALMKKAYCQYKISQFAEGKKTLALAQKKTEEYRTAIGETAYRTALQKRYEYEGYIENEEGNFELALKNYNAAIEINNKINTYESLIKNAQYFAFIGGVYNGQGKANKALTAYREAANIYLGIKNYLSFAQTLNNIAYCYFNLGLHRETLFALQGAYADLIDQNDKDNAGYSKSLMGSCYWELGKYDSALMVHKEAIGLRQQANNKKGQAWSWKQMGELYKLSGLKHDALLAYDTAGKLYRSVKDLAGQADVYLKAGKVYYNDENYYKAAQLYEMAKGVTPKTTVEALYNLGSAWGEVDAEKSKKYYLECKQKSDSAGNTTYQFFSARALAGIAYRNHDFALGDNFYNQCILLSHQLNTEEVKGYCLALKGQKFLNQTQLDSTLHYYYKALAIYDSVSKDDKIWQLISISDVYVSKGEFAKAEETLLQASSLAAAANNNLALGSSLQSLSFLYGLLGEFAKGFAANDSAQQIFKKSGNILSLANTYVSRGNIYKGSGEYKKSIEAMLFADSIYIAEKTADYRRTTLNNIGVTYYNQADYQTSMEYFHKAAKYLKPGIVNEDYLLNRSNIAECLYYLKKPKEAEDLYLKVYPEAKQKNLNRISSGMAIVLGRINFDANNFTKSLQYFDESRQYALVSKERDKLIESLIQIGKIDLKLGKREDAFKNFSQAINTAKEFGIASGWEAYYEMGVLFYNQQSLDSSITYFRTAVDLLNRYTQNVFGDEKAKKLFNNDPRKADLYFKLSYAYSKTGRPEEAFAYANLSGLAGLKELGGAQTVPGLKKKQKSWKTCSRKQMPCGHRHKNKPVPRRWKL